MSRNRLDTQTSPYLLQHVDNPVHWHPWDQQALDIAVQSNKPILLSIGYSACHWCHVMAHESFEDPATAEIMNKHFVNIKIDREERPDLDQIYQLAHQMLTQRGGGWPLTMFLTPDQHIPFFGGTYFPPQAAHGLPAFAELLGNVASFYELHQDKISEQSQSIMQVFRDSAPLGPDQDLQLNATPAQAGVKALISEFDAQHGGFGQAPKFPQTPSIERLMRDWRRSSFDAEPHLQSLFAATHSLTAMATSGLFDHVGGGFYRYTVDHLWRIPHFEKMLYDNAQLLSLYSDAWRATGDGVFGQAANQTADWLLHEMIAEDGGFFTALDADSEGQEGKFYVWQRNELKELLSEQEWQLVETRFGLDQKANFEDQWHLFQAKDLENLSEEYALEKNQVNQLLMSAQSKMYAFRAQREHPFCDEKRLCSSNALLIRAFALAGRHLDRQDLLDQAENIIDFIYQNMWKNDRLYTSYNQGSANLRGYLNDYAYLIDGILELLQVRWNDQHFAFCRQLADILLDQFYDPHDGGFFFTAEDHENLLHRMKPLADDASPSGNGIAARVLNRLGHLLAENRYITAAEDTIKLAWPALERVPHAHCSLLDALDEIVHPIHCIIIRGSHEVIKEWLPIATATYAPYRVVFGIPDDAKKLPDALAVRANKENGVAYICQGTQCSAPITQPGKLANALKSLK